MDQPSAAFVLAGECRVAELMRSAPRCSSTRRETLKARSDFAGARAYFQRKRPQRVFEKLEEWCPEADLNHRHADFQLEELLATN